MLRASKDPPPQPKRVNLNQHFAQCLTLVFFNLFNSFLTQVPDSVLEHFRGAAAKLVDSKGALDAVAAALAHISGTTEIKSRSLLSAQEVSDFHGIMRIRIVVIY